MTRICDCTGAPHEFRGVYRGGLLRALQGGVPSDRIQYGSAVRSIEQDAEGESRCVTKDDMVMSNICRLEPYVQPANDQRFLMLHTQEAGNVISAGHTAFLISTKKARIK
jgi:hypothetical protein